MEKTVWVELWPPRNNSVTPETLFSCDTIWFALPWQYSLMIQTVFPQNPTPEPKAQQNNPHDPHDSKPRYSKGVEELSTFST